ncbi:replicative DNA helicase [Phaeovibrio sulfidiphilus]|uniref:Replicative DNA helicase n=1 Tax=Phaeovibrio sulfidiphilus TaxID=1220600 RepID=A0A8J6YM36_9PROT|nr:replicative DNA helicase [Phaeovibrio sulfidiphilus]MBE1236339.1 replicative DNA helicase [Phaeovibrio sulfidiphilus]
MTPFSDPVPTPGLSQSGEGLAPRQLPANLEAEQALLGAILTNNQVLERVGDFLIADHFLHPAHQKIYAAAQNLFSQNHLANAITLKPYLEREPALEPLGGANYLVDLTASVVTILNSETYARLIQDLALRRSLIEVGEEMVNEAFAMALEEDAQIQIQKAEKRLFDLAVTGSASQGPVAFKFALTEALRLAHLAHERDGALAGAPTGLSDLDKKLGGLHNSDLLILAGRPSMGKTALATNIAYNVAAHFLDEARNGKPLNTVAFFSLEMSSDQLAARVLAERAEVKSNDMRTGDLSNEDMERVISVSSGLQSVPLYIDDTAALSVAAMRTRCRRLARQHGGDGSSLGLVIVDYLQLLRPNPGERHGNRVEEVSAITRALKELAKELNVPVIALSQLSRQVEQRDDKRPQLSDLRESGSIEQDADAVMFVYREEYYLERAEPKPLEGETDEKYAERHARWVQRAEEVHAVAEVIIAKQRHGPIGRVRLHFDKNFTRFSNLVEGDAPDDMDE